MPANFGMGLILLGGEAKSPMTLTESIVEDAALTCFGELGYAVGHGPQMAPGEAAVERGTFGEVVLAGRLRGALERLNPLLPREALEEAVRNEEMVWSVWLPYREGERGKALLPAQGGIIAMNLAAPVLRSMNVRRALFSMGFWILAAILAVHQTP
jgi:hypothetical protein